MIPAHDPAARRAQVDAFVRRHFRWPGALRLHAAALGADLLRAPANVALSPVFLLVRGLAWLCRRAGRPDLAARLAGRRILLRTAVSRRVEALVAAELLAPDPETRDPDPARLAAALADYAGARSAVAEMTTALLALIAGALAFGALTPGAISMAPGLAGTLAQAGAVAAFPLGPTLGGLWHAVFPAGASAGLVAAAAAGLLLASSVVAAFAGILADPVQARLGIHRRRLLRLLAALDAARDPARAGAPAAPFAAPEHLWARLFDLWDAGVGLLRALRG